MSHQPEASPIQLALVKRLNDLEERCELSLSPSIMTLVYKQNEEAIDRLFDRCDLSAAVRAIASMQDRLDKKPKAFGRRNHRSHQPV
jgi:hypothetical protein